MKDAHDHTEARVSVSISPFRFLGRQPILDPGRNVFGHEFLFRSGFANAFSGDAEDACRDVIDQCLLLTPKTGTAFSFVNCTRAALMNRIITLLPAARTVIEILETVDWDPELMEVCRDLKKQGYLFALDDYLPGDSRHPFLEIADFIKIDFQASDAENRQEIYAQVAATGAKLLAEKVETEQDVRQAAAEGCTLFQGYFFAKPLIVTTRLVPQDKATYLRLLAALTRSPADLSEVQTLVMAEPSLCYRLLRLVNSTVFALPSPVESIRSALLLVGDDTFLRMVIVAMAGVEATTNSKALVRMALERAKLCELLAPVMHESASRLYLLGMLSLIDVILAMPMSQVVESLPVDGEMKGALLGEKNWLSKALDFARCHESVNWQAYQEIEDVLGISDEAASMAYVQALQWADGVSRVLEG